MLTEYSNLSPIFLSAAVRKFSIKFFFSIGLKNTSNLCIIISFFLFVSSVLKSMYILLSPYFERFCNY